MTNEIHPEEKKAQKEKSPWIKIGMFFSTLGLILFIFTFAYGYIQFVRINLALAENVSHLQNKALDTHATVIQLQNKIEELEGALQKNQALFTKQEQLVNEWHSAQKGDLEKWDIAEAQYLVKLANDQIQYAQEADLAKVLIQRADAILEKQQDPSLLDVRKSLSNDLAQVDALPTVNTTNLYIQLETVDHLVDQLMLPTQPIQPETNDNLPQEEALPWWKAGLKNAWQALQQIIIIKKTTTEKSLPFILPEEKLFLYQNMHAYLANAKWAVLHKNEDVYQASLSNTIEWVQQYFQQDHAITQQIIQYLNDLKKINVAPPHLNFSSSLQQFDKYLSQINQNKQ